MIAAELAFADPLLKSVNKEIADLILIDIADSADENLNMDILDDLMDRSKLPIMFNDITIDPDSAECQAKLTKKIATTLKGEKQFSSSLLNAGVGTVISSRDQNLTSSQANSIPPKKPPRIKSRLGKMLIESGRVSLADIEAALDSQQETGKRLGEALIDMGLLSELELAITLAKQQHVQLARPEDYPDKPILTKEIAERFSKRHKFIPLQNNSDNIVLAMLNTQDKYVPHAVQVACLKPVVVCAVVNSEFLEVAQRYYGSDQTLMEQITNDIGGSSQQPVEDDVDRLMNMASEAPIIRLVSLIIHNAIAARASDIHIEPFEKEFIIRYRIDGILQNVEAPPHSSSAAVISRIKIMAKLDIAERRLPQDGRIKLRIENRDVDLRVATAPTLYGENVVIRILLDEQIECDFEQLGFDGKPFDDYLKCLAKPNGILLVTGPTGSGKTTTLYTSLQKINSPGRKIITVEDPVEYQLAGINQIQAKPAIGLTFAKALRSIVRLDPDVIMIGEIRDLETAAIAIQSALTGHLVISTLHTNDAPSSISRLLDMGVDDYLITSALNGVLAQRLVRQLCPLCRKSYTPSETHIEDIRQRNISNDIAPIWYREGGCEKCNGTGFTGRIGILQMMVMTESLRQLVMERASVGILRAAAEQEGMISLYNDGLRKVMAGQTTMEEIIKVTES